MRNRTLILAVAAGALLAMGLALHFSPGREVASQDVARTAAPADAAALPAPRGESARATQPERDRRAANAALARFLDLKARADDHDARAQYALSELYGLCQSVNLDPGRFVATHEAMASQSRDALNARQLIATARQVAIECAAVDGGAVIPMEATLLWRQAAADGGDLPATIKQYMSAAEKPTGRQLQGLIDQVVASGDPQSVFELGQLIAGTEAPGDVGSYGGMVGDRLAGYAWSIAACRMGLDCQAGGFLMNTTCLNTGYCSGASFEDFVRVGLVTRADQPILDARIDEVTSRLRGR